MNAKLTDRQRWYLNLLSAKPMSTTDLTEGRRFVESCETVAATNAVFQRLKRRGLVVRNDWGDWEITSSGREFLASGRVLA